MHGSLTHQRHGELAIQRHPNGLEAGAAGYDGVDGHYKEPEYDDPVFLLLGYVEVKYRPRCRTLRPHVAFVDIGHFGMWGGRRHDVTRTRAYGDSTHRKRIIDPLPAPLPTHTALHIRRLCRTRCPPGSRFPITDYAFEHG